MASKTEYEMLWKLGAQLGQDFNGTFSSAQKTATVKQLNSVKLMRQRELKGLTGNANF